MAYKEQIREAAKWLAQCQNPDGSWGLTPSQAGSLVNTAEAIFVLAIAADEHSRIIESGIKYIRENWSQHLEQRGPKLRFVGFPLMLLRCVGRERELGHERRKMETWLSSQVNDDGGWGAIKGAVSDIFSTFSAVQALNNRNTSDPLLVGAKTWILSSFKERGWSLEPNGALSPTATAYALISLHYLLEGKEDERVAEAKAYLLQNSHWEDETASLAGTMWQHSRHSSVISALALWLDDFFSRTIADGILYSNRLINSEGGWNEARSTADTRSVRSQYWAASYSQTLIDQFDPSKFILRVDAERTDKSLLAPKFQHFFVGTDFTIVGPTVVLKTVNYLLMGLGALFAVDIFLYSADASFLLDNYLGVLFLLASFFIMRSRPKVFSSTYRFAVIVVAILSALNLAFGVTIIGAFSQLTSSSADAWSWFLSWKEDSD